MPTSSWGGAIELGVSVTRAFCGPHRPFLAEDAERLLRKKLGGVLKSTATCCNADWRKQLLHVWVADEAAADVLYDAYARLEPALVADTVVLVTRVAGLPELFSEKAAPPQSRTRTRALKGAKDEEHLRVLAESDPTRKRGSADTERRRGDENCVSEN